MGSALHLPFPAQKPALLPTFEGVGLNVDRQLLGGQVSWHPQRQDLKGGEGSKARHAGQAELPVPHSRTACAVELTDSLQAENGPGSGGSAP